MADDGVKLERIIAWCAVHPDEVPFALHHLMRRRDKHDAAPLRLHNGSNADGGATDTASATRCWPERPAFEIRLIPTSASAKTDTPSAH